MEEIQQIRRFKYILLKAGANRREQPIAEVEQFEPPSCSEKGYIHGCSFTYCDNGIPSWDESAGGVWQNHSPGQIAGKSVFARVDCLCEVPSWDGCGRTFVAATLLWIAVMTVFMVRSTCSTRKSQNVGHGKGSILKVGGGGRPRSGANADGGNHQSNV
ncbi:hypothetical protein RHMOL_Rhmol01G0036000 [Rhododendron molle]|uniref:Uncharacterized protein n=1 Tax=Rhododendron molle TaxID=49168 RepID=A0ACC0PXJ2_RHOML|nr:hypothetical protein RHMOL_Rhmol01G0036000 [Rhododendron molle]